MILQEKDIKPFFNIISKFEVMRSTHKLSNGMFISFSKKDSKILLVELVDKRNNISFFGTYYIPLLPEDITAFINKLNEYLVYTYLHTLYIESPEFKEGIQLLVENEPSHPTSKIIRNMFYLGLTDLNDEDFKELWDDVVRGNYK